MHLLKILFSVKKLVPQVWFFEIIFKKKLFIWEGSCVDQRKQGCSLLIGSLFPRALVPGRTLVKAKLLAAVPESRCDFSSEPSSTRSVPRSLLKMQSSLPQWPAEGSLYFPMLYCCWKKPRPFPGMKWACLSPHFSTSLVTTPFLAFIGNDIFLCSLSPTHAPGRQGQLSCFKRLERKCRDL